jgi:hypothetical protein
MPYPIARLSTILILAGLIVFNRYSLWQKRAQTFTAGLLFSSFASYRISWN